MIRRSKIQSFFWLLASGFILPF